LNSDNSALKSEAVSELGRITEVIFSSKAKLVDIGYSEIAIESFHDVSHLFGPTK